MRKDDSSVTKVDYQLSEEASRPPPTALITHIHCMPIFIELCWHIANELNVYMVRLACDEVTLPYYIETKYKIL